MQLTVQDAFALAARHESAGRSTEARRIYDEILAALPEHPGALLRIAEQELASGAPERAKGWLQRALASAQQQALPAQEIWLALARAGLAAGDLAAAAKAIEEVHAAAKRLKSMGAVSAACALLQDCVTLAPADADLRVTLGAVLLDANRAADAQRELERALDLGARGGELWDNLGIAHRLQGDDDQALRAFERAAAANPDSARLVGIRVGWMIALGWGMSAAIGAVAGMLIAPVVFLEPNMMLGVLLYGFAGAVLGGLSSPGGAVLGGFAVGIIENLAGAFIPYFGRELKLTIALIVIVAVLLVRPSGVFGRSVVSRV